MDDAAQEAWQKWVLASNDGQPPIWLNLPDEIAECIPQAFLDGYQAGQVAANARLDAVRELADELTPTDERRNWADHISNRIRRAADGDTE